MASKRSRTPSDRGEPLTSPFRTASSPCIRRLVAEPISRRNDPGAAPNALEEKVRLKGYELAEGRNRGVEVRGNIKGAFIMLHPKNPPPASGGFSRCWSIVVSHPHGPVPPPAGRAREPHCEQTIHAPAIRSSEVRVKTIFSCLAGDDLRIAHVAVLIGDGEAEAVSEARVQGPRLPRSTRSRGAAGDAGSRERGHSPRCRRVDLDRTGGAE